MLRCVILLPGGSHQGQSRQCWGQGCLCYPQQLASGSPGTQNHLRSGEEDHRETESEILFLDLQLVTSVSVSSDFFTWVSLLCKSNDMFTINIVILQKEWKKRNLLVEITEYNLRKFITFWNWSNQCFFMEELGVSYPDLIHVVWLQLPQGWSWEAQIN